MTKVKICGLRTVEHALVAAQAGADFLGIVFAPSHRQILPEEARKIIQVVTCDPEHPRMVGIFVNRPTSEINEIANYCKLDWVQLSGTESWDSCKEIEYPIIKTIHISATKTSDEVIDEIEKGHQLHQRRDLRYLIDTRMENTFGGTGQTFDWRIAAIVAARFPVIIAGGLTPVNVNQLLGQVKPWGVDVSSGVETNGHKDTNKIKCFIQAVKSSNRRRY